MTGNIRFPGDSLPYRQLRRQKIFGYKGQEDSLPYRQLRSFYVYSHIKSHYSLPYRQLRRLPLPAARQQ